MPNDHVTRLLDLLEEEKALLLKGDIEAVANLAKGKRGLAETLSEQNPPASEQLKELQQKTRRNAALLDASRRGVKAAGSRLEAIRKAMLQLNTYSSGGKRRDLQHSLPRVERRV